MIKSNIELSVCLIVRNEEKLIERCLKSVQDIADEIIVIHDGQCSDKTITVARSYGCEILILEEKGFMEAHLPIACQRARGEWFLRIDADEFLSDSLRTDLRGLMKDQLVDAYEFIWPIFDGTRYRTKQWPYKRCLFRRLKMSFLALPHYTIKVEGVIRKIPLVLEHQPLYNNYSWNNVRKKLFIWSKIQASLYLKDFKTIEKFNYQAKDWPTIIFLRQIIPLAMLPFDFLIVFLKLAKSKILFTNFFAWRVAFFQGLYKAAIDWNIFKLKNNSYTYVKE